MSDPHTPSSSDVDATDAADPAGLDRRNFLKISSAAAAVAVAAPSLARDKKTYPVAARRTAAKDLKGGWFMV